MTPEAILTDEELIPTGAKGVLPPYGFVNLLEAHASDLEVVNAARVSFNRRSEWDMSGEVVTVSHPNGHEETRGALFDGDEKVLRFLVKNRHGTPFEHTFFKFHVRAPIFVFREWHRHRIGVSINEESARYVPLQPHFYVPEGDALRTQTDKPGRYKFEPLQPHIGQAVQSWMRESYAASYDAYERMLAEGVAKEIARTVLPVGIYSQMIWTCNARSLMAFLSLRNAETALREIRLYAQAMEEYLAELMPVTHNAFVENGRQSP